MYDDITATLTDARARVTKVVPIAWSTDESWCPTDALEEIYLLHGDDIPGVLGLDSGQTPEYLYNLELGDDQATEFLVGWGFGGVLIEVEVSIPGAKRLLLGYAQDFSKVETTVLALLEGFSSEE